MDVCRACLMPVEPRLLYCKTCALKVNYKPPEDDDSFVYKYKKPDMSETYLALRRMVVNYFDHIEKEDKLQNYVISNLILTMTQFNGNLKVAGT